MHGHARGWVSYGPAPVTVEAAGNGELTPELADVGRLARRGLRAVIGAARADQRPQLSRILADHLGATVHDVVEENWPAYDYVNVQAGIDAWLARPGRSFELVGVVTEHGQPVDLAGLLSTVHSGNPFGPRPGNAASVNVACGPDGQVRPCVRCGLYLVTEGGHRTAVLLRAPMPQFGREGASVQVVSTDREAAPLAAAEIREAALENNVFRGQVLSFGQEVFGHGETLLQFHRRPSMSADQLILAPEALAQVQRQVVEVARHKTRLLAAGQHLKRGLLLYGPPGVGKTHTVRYLTASLVGTTVIQLTGNALHLIAEACSVARTLQPAMLIIEDVDLIAEDRGMHPGHHPLLFQLLNEMDGLAEDADVVFVLTTNRADLLEPALAARPGRVDQAVELELPDAAARRALIELYRGSLRVDTSELDDVLARTEGVTASFLKELLRRAALLAATRTAVDSELAVSAGDLRSALDELLDTRNAMTRTLLGSGPGIDSDA
ncbi:MAG: AAA family ATPase [Blastococcus sp.]